MDTVQPWRHDGILRKGMASIIIQEWETSNDNAKDTTSTRTMGSSCTTGFFNAEKMLYLFRYSDEDEVQAQSSISAVGQEQPSFCLLESLRKDFQHDFCNHVYCG